MSPGPKSESEQGRAESFSGESDFDLLAMAGSRADPRIERVLRGYVGGLDMRVEHLERDLGEVRTTLARLAPKIDQMHGTVTATLPTLATKAELERRPTRAQNRTDIFGIFGLIAAVLAAAYYLWGRGSGSGG